MPWTRDKASARARTWPAAAGVLVGAAGSYLALRRMRAHALSARRGYEVPEDIDIGGGELLRAVESLTGATVAEGNLIEPLRNGDRIFPALLGAIRGATRTLNLLPTSTGAGRSRSRWPRRSPRAPGQGWSATSCSTPSAPPGSMRP